VALGGGWGSGLVGHYLDLTESAPVTTNIPNDSWRFVVDNESGVVINISLVATRAQP